MRRLAVAALALGLVVVPAATAAAQLQPDARFTSPQRAVAGAPIFVRSITPCPVTGGYEYATVYIRPQSTPSVPDEVDYTMADLRPDGSWEVTIAAPVDMPDGVTKSYSVHAECTRDAEPYFNDFFGDAEPPVPSEHFRYPLRPLFVTGFGPSEVVEGEGPSGTSTTTTVPTTSTSVATVAAAGVPKARVTTTAAPTVSSVPGVEDDSAERIAAARAELAAGGVDTAAMSDAEVLASSARGGSEPVDGGIPWWAFALATLLAVSGVVAFGVRRTSVLDQLDREPSGD